MKHLKTGILCLSAILFTCLIASAQSVQKANFPKEPDNSKPRLFRNIPEKVAVSLNTLLPVAKLKKGESASLTISDKFVFKGTVVSSVSKYDNALKTIVIKSPEFSGANLSISQITLPDGTVTYRGRIINFQYGDCLELKSENGQYFFVKKNLNDMMTD